MRDKILIVDDESDIVSMLKDYFEWNGYDVLTAFSGNEAVKKAEKQPDIILLDINMPDMDGLAVCKTIREFVTCPILFLTARIEDGDKLEGFGAGGDDYIVKPFSIDILGARVAAHLRREKRRRSTPKVNFDNGLAIDYSAQCIYFHDKPVNLAPKEFEIIRLLSLHSGQIFSKEQIYEHIWGYDSPGDSSVISEHIRRIRAKFSALNINTTIETVWGVGYVWKRRP